MEPTAPPSAAGQGVPAAVLADEDLVRELEQLHRTRADTLRHGSDSALATHDARTDELEAEYVRRWPDREVDPARTRAGRRGEGSGSGAHQEESR